MSAHFSSFRFIVPSLSMLALASFAVSPILAEEQQRPNVIYILADDMGIGDLGVYGQKIIKTPAIDALARDGMLFTQHYSGSTVSAPSRCVLLTGKHTGNAYVRGNLGVKGADGLPYDLDLADKEQTLGELFASKGYTTACIGKWGLGRAEGEGNPNKQGFDYFFGYLSQINAHSHYPQHLFENSKKVMLKGKVFSQDLMTEKVLNFVDEQEKKPFFLYWSPTIPHAALQTPPEGLGEFAKLPKGKNYHNGGYAAQGHPRAAFAALMTRFDQDIAKLVDLLRKKRMLGNTIIMISSDNGTHLEGGHDPKFFNSNAGFRGTKRDLYEGGIRAPFIVHWPDKIKAGQVTPHVSAFWDMMPTMAELIGADVPQYSDGISLLPTLLQKGKQAQHDALYFEFHEQGGKQAILDKDGWKLIRLNVNFPKKERYELYNLKDDIKEKRNLAAERPEKLAELKKLMLSEHSKNKHFRFAFEKK